MKTKMFLVAMLFLVGSHAYGQKTKPDKLCAKHSSWTADDCERVANHTVWVGMTREMVLAERPSVFKSSGGCVDVTKNGPKAPWGFSHAKPAPGDVLEYWCMNQWDPAVPQRGAPYVMRFEFKDSIVVAFSQN